MRTRVKVKKVYISDEPLRIALVEECDRLREEMRIKLSEAQQRELTLLEQIALLQQQLTASQKDVELLHYACSSVVSEARKDKNHIRNLLAAARAFADRAGSIPPEADAAVAFVHPASDYARIAEAVKKTE